jgi:hypothetical protein
MAFKLKSDISKQGGIEVGQQKPLASRASGMPTTMNKPSGYAAPAPKASSASPPSTDILTMEEKLELLKSWTGTGNKSAAAGAYPQGETPPGERPESEIPAPDAPRDTKTIAKSAMARPLAKMQQLWDTVSSRGLGKTQGSNKPQGPATDADAASYAQDTMSPPGDAPYSQQNSMLSRFLSFFNPPTPSAPVSTPVTAPPPPATAYPAH